MTDSIESLRAAREYMRQWYADRTRLANEIIIAAESVVEAHQDGLNHGKDIDKLDAAVKAYDKFNKTHEQALDAAYGK